MDTVARAVLLLFGRTGAYDESSFGPDLVGAAGELRGRVEGQGGTVRAGTRLANDPLAAIARERELRLLDGAIEVTLPHSGDVGGLVHALDGFAAMVGDTTDTDASIVVAGPCHLVRAGIGPVMLASTGRRRPDISRAEHSEWWLHVHGPMSMRLVPDSRGYQQLHGDPDASRAAATAAGVGGPAMDFAETAYFDSVEAFTTPMADPSVGTELVQDEARCIDHTSIVAAMCEVIT